MLKGRLFVKVRTGKLEMKRLLAAGIIITLIVGVIVALVLLLQPAQIGSVYKPDFPGRISITWQDNEAETTTSNTEGEFKVRGYLASPQGILFFYSYKLKSPQSLALQFEATSQTVTTPGQAQAKINPLKVKRVQALGKLEDFETGVVEVTVINSPGQLISLGVTPVGRTNPAWQVTPIKQGKDFVYDSSNYYYQAKSTNSDLNLKFGNGDDNNLSTLELSLASSSTNISSQIYYRIDKSLTVTSIPAADYRSKNPPIPDADTQVNSSQKNPTGYYPTPAPLQPTPK